MSFYNFVNLEDFTYVHTIPSLALRLSTLCFTRGSQFSLQSIKGNLLEGYISKNKRQEIQFLKDLDKGDIREYSDSYKRVLKHRIA